MKRLLAIVAVFATAVFLTTTPASAHHQRATMECDWCYEIGWPGPIKPPPPPPPQWHCDWWGCWYG